MFVPGTYNDGNGGLPDDQPVVGQTWAESALEGAGSVHGKLVGTRGCLSNGHSHILAPRTTSRSSAVKRIIRQGLWYSAPPLRALADSDVPAVPAASLRTMHAPGWIMTLGPSRGRACSAFKVMTVCILVHPVVACCLHTAVPLSLQQPYLGQMIQQDLSVACHHGGRGWIALPLAHGGEELIPCLCSWDKDSALQILRVEDVLEHWVQRQVCVLTCNQIQS